MDNTAIRRVEVRSPVHFLAQFISIVFHPIFITSYLAAFLLFIHPAAFTGFEPKLKFLRFLTVFLSTVFLPVFSIFICWRLKLVHSLYLKTPRERIIPYVIVMFFYWWTFYVFRNLPDSPPVIVHLTFGSFLAICGGWMCNIFFKISMHAIAMGGMLMFALLFAFNDSYSSGLYLSAAVLIVGLVCTARFLVSDHSPREIYAGLLVGLLAQLIAWYFPF